ncbi:ABC transporter permease [Arthrobacter sp. KK5.5]|uniref:ABC transporter permease n=1 Tax=Arthrobacter sp. KK5.5 TaxID=3373084 RepID=UPI003EE6262A
MARVGSKPRLFEYIRELWRFREFVYVDSKSRVEAGKNQERLGLLWLVLTPILNGLTYYLIFGLLLQTQRGIENFLGYLVIGVFMFAFTSRSVTSGARAILSNQTVIKAFSFPRGTVVLAANVRELLQTVPAVITMVLLILALPPAEKISWLWLMMVPVIVLQFVLNVGLSLILARLISAVPDFGQILNFLVRVWMYGSGVFYSFDRYVTHPTVQKVLEFNPLFCVLDIMRDVILYGTVPALTRWLVLGGWAFASVCIGIVYFWKAEESYGRD